MPVSPATRISPVRGSRVENHKRGHSLESGFLFRERDDDLALFNEVQNKERDNFLLRSNDDFDDIFSTKLRYFSDYKLGISIPACGETSDLLKAEGDKNDYDWLITPPDTPLFHSLDDEAQPVSLAPRGRPRSQPVGMSRSLTMEKGYRSARSSASPHRFSPSPRSGSSPLPPRSRPISATCSSPPSALRHSSPSRRRSPPPSKPTPAPRSGTPASRRMSTGSAESRARGTSPVKTARGSSASPKMKAWQSNIPGFSSEAPPNLRTSLADRPASYVRGSSPVSRNSARSSRQSTSPTASRSVPSHSHDKKQFSSYSRGSIGSADDIDLQQSSCIISSDCAVTRNMGSSPSNLVMGFSKKPNKALSSSAPKRSLDLVLRQMDRKSPENMFRPLLSSVPSSTFYVGKANVHQHSAPSRNSSMTTSSNASSDQGMSGTLGTEESRQNLEDVTSTFMQGQYETGNDELFTCDRAETAGEGVANRIIEKSSGHQHGKNDGSVAIVLLDVAEGQLDTTVLDKNYGSSDFDSSQDMEVCSKCNRRFCPSELSMGGDPWLCHECMCLEVNSEVKPMMREENNTEGFVQTLECRVLEAMDQSISITESIRVTCTGETRTKSTNHVEDIAPIANNSQGSYGSPVKDLITSLSEEVELTFVTQPGNIHSVDGGTAYQQPSQSRGSSDVKVSVSQDIGVPVLLKRSSMGRRYIVHSKSFTESNSSYDDFSYARDSFNSMRSSIGHSSAMFSSSADLGSSRQSDTHIHQQLNGQASDMGNYRCDTPLSHKRSVSSWSGASGNVYQVGSVTPSCPADALEVIAPNTDKEVMAVACADSHDLSLASECTDAESTCTDLESNVMSRTAAEISIRLTDDIPGDMSMVLALVSEEPASHGNGNIMRDKCYSENGETLSAHLQTSNEGEDTTQSPYVNRMDVPEFPHRSSLDTISEMEIGNVDIVLADVQSTVNSPNIKNSTGELMEPPILVACDDVLPIAGTEYDQFVPDGALEESTIVLEGGRGTKSRSLTLEEATDAILFCSSIVHNLAYEAANIAMNKENSPPEEVQPSTLTFLGKTNCDRRDMRLRTLGRRSSKSQKARQRRLEIDAKPPPVVAETDEKSTPHIIRSPSKGDSMYPPKLESKCNCTIM